MESPLFPSDLVTGHERGFGETGKGMARKDYVAPPLPGPPPAAQRQREEKSAERRFMERVDLPKEMVRAAGFEPATPSV